ncbi:FRIGIDA-like protein, partial [Drosera capensis]
ITPVSQVALVGDGQPQLRTPQVVNSDTRHTTGPKDVLDTLCKEMDAKGLSSYLIFHGNMQNLSQKKVLDALRFASDPARLVFNVLQGFSETCSEDNIERESNTTVSTLLLEQLMELSPDVTSDLRAEASKFAAHWKARLDKEEAKARKFASNGKASHGKDVYKLGSYFDGNEVVALFGTCYNDDEVYRLEQNVHLCRSLSLEDKIPGIVEALIKKKKLLVAVRYICALDLVSRFPPFPLLKQYVEMEIKRCKTRNTVSGQNKLAWREVTALRHVMKCISDHKQLESQCSLSAFEQRIQQLEEEIAERNRKAAEVAPDDKKIPSPSSSSTKESAQVICSSSTKGPEAQVRRKRTASASTNGPRPRDTTQEKRPKVVDTCTSRCQPPEKSQENSPRTATPNTNSDAGTCAAKPPSQPPCSTGPVTNHNASVMSNAGNSCSTAQQTNAPVNSHYQISYPSRSVTSHIPGWPDGAPAAVPASGQHSYFNQTQLVPSAYYPDIGVDPRQFVTGGAYPDIGPSHIPHGPVFNQPTQTPGYHGQFYNPFAASPYGAQQIFYHTQ